jgi:O-antigen ligase
MFAALSLPQIGVTLVRYLLPVYFFLRLASRPKATLKILQGDIFLVIFNVILFGSLAWSVNPDLTLESLRSEYIQAVMTALFLATRFSVAQQVRLMAIATIIFGCLSFLFAVIFPDVGVHSLEHAGAWRGIVNHKNYFSSVLVLGAASHLVLLLDPRERRWWQYMGLGLSIFLIIMSTSKTGQVLLCSLFIMMLLYPRFRWRGMRTVLTIYLIIFAILILTYGLFAAWDQIFVAIGRDPTLTGRTPIWQRLTEEYIPNRFWLGYGVASFWRSDIFRGLNFIPSHGHNGWYDLILDVGIAGFIMYLACSVQAWARTFRLAYSSEKSSDLWPLALLTALMINNFTESLLLYQGNTIWILFMSVCWSLKEELQLKKLNDHI